MKINWLTLARSVPVTAYVIAGCGALLFAAYTANNSYQRRLGREQVLTANARADAAKWKRTADSLAKAYHIDTVRLTRYRLRLDTMSTTVELWKHDTVKVVEYVAKADSTVRVCAQALQTCEQRVFAIQNGWDATKRELALSRTASHSRSTLGAASVGAVVGAGIALLLRK
jgi:hypothetical protein